jgi:hypothetical protein
MPEDKVIPYGPEEYPKLEGLAVGSKVSFSGEATIEDLGGESRGLKILTIDLQTENRADREMRDMKGMPETYASENESEVEL